MRSLYYECTPAEYYRFAKSSRNEKSTLNGLCSLLRGVFFVQ